MFFFKKRFDNRKNSKNLTKLASFSFEKKSRKGGQSGKNPTIRGDLYDQGGSKNRGFHDGRKFGGHFLIEHPVSHHALLEANDAIMRLIWCVRALNQW